MILENFSRRFQDPARRFPESGARPDGQERSDPIPVHPQDKGAAMKNVYAIAAFMLLMVGSANAGETGIINQAGPYEAQMRFYLHPALGFPGKAEAAAPSARADDPNADGKLTVAGHRTRAASTAPRASHPARPRSSHIAAAERD
jgi:hypothetical protein